MSNYQMVSDGNPQVWCSSRGKIRPSRRPFSRAGSAGRFHVLQLLRQDPCDEEEAMRRDNCMNNSMEVGHLAISFVTRIISPNPPNPEKNPNILRV